MNQNKPKQSRAANHVQSIGKDDLWMTPPYELIEFLELHQIILELDVCATKNTAQFPNYYGPDQEDWDKRDAFRHQWDKPFFCNPPYSEVEKWLLYGIEQAMAHGVDAVFLVYAKTDTEWWANCVSEFRDILRVYHKRGRIKFWKDGKPYIFTGKDGKRKIGVAPYGSAWLVIKH